MGIEEPSRTAWRWSGWVMFAGFILAAVGAINAIQGLAALMKDEIYIITEAGLLVVTDFTVWGWLLVIWGALMILAGIGLFSAKAWARWFALALVFLNLVGQFAWFTAYPLWSMVAIALNVLVLFALTARWDEAREGLGV